MGAVAGALEARLGVPCSHLQLFFSHLVWSSFSRKLSRRPCMEAPLLVHSEPDLGVPCSHLQVFGRLDNLADAVVFVVCHQSTCHQGYRYSARG